MKPMKLPTPDATIKRHTNADVVRFLEIFANDIKSMIEAMEKSLHNHFDLMERRFEKKFANLKI